MKLKIFLFLVLASLLSSPNAQAVMVLDNQVWSGNGHSYYLLAGDGVANPTGLSWSDAENYAVNTLGGHLATVDSAQTQSWIWDTFGKDAGRNLWIGFTDQATEGDFRWIADGQPSTYTNWYPYEPNNYNNEDYVFILKSNFVGGSGAGEGLWNDGPNGWTSFFDAPIYAIAETSRNPSAVPEPASLALIGSGLVGIFFRRKFIG